jgi:hypothetical protein
VFSIKHPSGSEMLQTQRDILTNIHIIFQAEHQCRGATHFPPWLMVCGCRGDLPAGGGGDLPVDGGGELPAGGGGDLPAGGGGDLPAGGGGDLAPGWGGDLPAGGGGDFPVFRPSAITLKRSHTHRLTGYLMRHQTSPATPITCCYIHHKVVSPGPSTSASPSPVTLTLCPCRGWQRPGNIAIPWSIS